MNEISMTKEELARYVGTLAEGATITVCRTKEEVPLQIRLVAETVKTEKGVWISFVRTYQGLVIAAWVFASSIFPDYIPEPDIKIVAASALIGTLDTTFPHVRNLGQPLAYVPNYLPSGSNITGTGYYIPPSGFAGGSASLG